MCTGGEVWMALVAGLQGGAAASDSLTAWLVKLYGARKCL